jgi:hypothetical protein
MPDIASCPCDVACTFGGQHRWNTRTFAIATGVINAARAMNIPKVATILRMDSAADPSTDR